MVKKAKQPGRGRPPEPGRKKPKSGSDYGFKDDGKGNLKPVNKKR